MPGCAFRNSIALLDVERDALEIDGRLVVVRAGVHAENREAPLRQFLGRDHVEEVRRPVHRQEGDRRRSALGAPQGALGGVRLEGDVFTLDFGMCRDDAHGKAGERANGAPQ